VNTIAAVFPETSVNVFHNTAVLFTGFFAVMSISGVNNADGKMTNGAVAGF
jgi:hypothetical protein